ncbi:hypothetical protein [Saccharopolyspora hattusasensis]|uniref:hypothetical protein n=1 Tax=Saccharopolyspora hattusasensis TaxID=1128679 RepID=UPI003D955AA6
MAGLQQLVSLPEAAARLQISQKRARDLARGGQLRTIKLGREYLVDVGSIRHRQQVMHPQPGRPLSPRMAWALLVLASGEEPDWVSPAERSRLRRYLSRNIEQWPRLLQSRAELHRIRILAGPLRKLRELPGVASGGISAAARYGLDLMPSGAEHELYVPAESFRELREAGRIKLGASEPNVVVRVLPDQLPISIARDGLAPPAAVAVDLLEAGDERSARAGKRLLDQSGAGRR